MCVYTGVLYSVYFFKFVSLLEWFVITSKFTVLMFSLQCINEERLQKYTYFKIHDTTAHKYYSILEYRRDLLKRQIMLYKLHHFCNTSSPDDGPGLGWKYFGNN